MAACPRIAPYLTLLVSISIFFSSSSCGAAAGNLKDDFEVTWAAENVRFEDGGEALQLVLEPSTGGAGFASKDYFLFGNIDMQMKLVPGDSAGTVTAYYLSSETSNHDELDFEFLGNSSGEPYILQTNVFSNGTSGREQRIFLWFDPTADFHTYSVTWTQQRIVFLVDGVPIRVFSNNEAAKGVPYLNKQPMRVFSSIWNGDSWATRGGQVKIDWAHAPFIASYRNFTVAESACVKATSAAACSAQAATIPSSTTAVGEQQVDTGRLQWVESNFMVYNYCTDQARYPIVPLEC
ncbi:hypothetical protein GOP47_0004743 [Adiantum capillus-veneris]|uniref:Xyloglucan endotransglucosylase/hydrolase n=1 Tax=Adiantum capillus-veneris TaxID=13818 RepID=A0A9D4V481_ADICA|nr:hypothetical protein GOP47_0004743 [Adiantum capillus-veneris]